MSYPKRLAIVAHLAHYKNNVWFSYEPYVREINLWAEIFDEIYIYTEVVNNTPLFALKELPSNCIVKPIFLNSGPGLLKKIIRLFQIPIVFCQIVNVYFSFDLIHTRTSSFSTLFVNLLNLVFNKPTIEKWATNFPPDKSIGKFSHYHSLFLKFAPDNTIVFVYSDVNKSNFRKSFPAMFSSGELKIFENGVNSLKWNRASKDFKYVCVSRLHIDKNVLLIIEAVDVLVNKFKTNFVIEIIGDGPLMDGLKKITNGKKLQNNIIFRGSKSFMEVIQILQNSNFLIMPGINEGWGKVINEAIATDCLPLVVKGGNAEKVIDSMGNAGFLFTNNSNSLAQLILETVNLNVGDILKKIEIGKKHNENMTLECYKKNIFGALDEFKF